MEIHHDLEQQKFELKIDGQIALLTYRLLGNRLIITHTGVPENLEGRGIGSSLVRKCLDFARAQQYSVETTCWFAQGYLDRHPEYQTLISHHGDE